MEVLIRDDAEARGIDWLAVAPAAHGGDPMDLDLTLVNGGTMQDESTAEMVFDVAALATFVPTVPEMRPGDLILTGSTAGDRASRADVMEATIDGLAMQRTTCVAELPIGCAAAA